MRKIYNAVILILLLAGMLYCENSDTQVKSNVGVSAIDMVFVEDGTFQMGSNDGENDEKPVHSVTVSDFYIGKYEVTQGEYESIMGKNPAKSYGVGDDYPVYYVSWNDAVKFCNKLSDKEGLQRCYSRKLFGSFKSDFFANGYRLPTEAEWEFAARDGNKTHTAGDKQANELGINDMSGNVWEWCNDWYGSYSSSGQTNPRGQNSGSHRVNRGGSWKRTASGCRASDRSRYIPVCRYDFLGFRFACSSK